MVVAQFLDIEQAVLLLELEPPFDKRAVQLARRRMAKRWHPDIAPPGRQHEHERHLKAINEAADQLERLAEDSRGGRSPGTRSRSSAAAARKARAEEGGRAPTRRSSARAQHAADREKHDPFASRVPDHSVVHRYARCLSYPEWGVGSVNGIYFTGEGDDIQQWARVSFQVGVRTVPAGSLQFVDFSKPDPGAERVERFMTAAKHALAEGDFELAAQRLVYARDAEPENPAVLRLLTLAFWQAGNLAAAGRAVRDWARVEPERPAPYRYAARIYEDKGALSHGDRRRGARDRARAADDGSAWERLGPAAAAHVRPRGRARGARARARDRAERAGPARPRAGLQPDGATPAPRSAPARRRRSSRRSPARPGRGSPTRSPAPTARATASPPATARSSCSTTPRCATSASRCSRAQPRAIEAAA